MPAKIKRISLGPIKLGLDGSHFKRRKLLLNGFGGGDNHLPVLNKTGSQKGQYWDF